jgi:hypothetical protein
MTTPMFNLSSVSAKAAADKIAAELILEEILDQMSAEFVGRRQSRTAGSRSPTGGPETGGSHEVG